MGFVEVTSTRELPLGSIKGVEAGGKPVLVANFEGKYFAIGNVCTHMGCTQILFKLKLIVFVCERFSKASNR